MSFFLLGLVTRMHLLPAAVQKDSILAHESHPSEDHCPDESKHSNRVSSSSILLPTDARRNGAEVSRVQSQSPNVSRRSPQVSVRDANTDKC